jgi:hypothetical protein
MYNWRQRKEDNETDAAFASRVVSNNILALVRYINRRGDRSLAFGGTFTSVVYLHNELGDDSYSGADKGSAEHPYQSPEGITADNISNVVVICCGNFNSGYANLLYVADTYGSAVFNNVQSNTAIYCGCYLKAALNVSFQAMPYNCIIDAMAASNIRNNVTAVCSVFINVSSFMTGGGPSVLIGYCCTFINCAYGSQAFKQYDSIWINSVLQITGTTFASSAKTFYYNSLVNVSVEHEGYDFVDLGETYQSANDCFVDPIHLNFAIRRSEVRAGTPFSDWLGFTGDSVDFVKVTGNNIQSDSGSWTIDQQTPGEGRLLGAIVDNRGQFNNVFTGFNNVVFHYNSNNISIGPHEKFGTPVEVSAGENETLTITDEGMYCVSKDCEIEDVSVSKYQNIWLEAGSYSVDSSNGVKFFPYNYESINNYVGCRFTNLGKCTTYVAGRTLKANCSYLNQGSADVTVSDGTVVAPGKTYVTPDQSSYTADGNLLLVFDDAVDNFVWFNTNSFQTKYKAGYVVVNKKTEQNLLTRDGKTIPCTEAFGEYNDIRYLASQNEQSDFFQVVVDYKVYPF